MAQSTNLNVSPYFDDFNADDNYYKVLFKPGFPVQARELTGLQSILQDQIAKFGTHMFKEGAKVIPGNTSYNDNFQCVEINNEYLGVTVKSYIDQLLNRKIVGLTSGVSATIVKILDSTDSIRDNLTLYVRYDSSSVANENETFLNGELLGADTDIISGPENSTFIPRGESFAGAISTNATSTGSSYSISEGVYFIRGTFVNVASQTILLDQYSNTPTGRIGLRVLEETVNSDEDSSLTDNSKGFNNFAAPGADRLKITCSLFFKALDDNNDDDFVELASVRNGALRARPTTSDYNLLNDELARRTFAESGDYTTKPFSVKVRESLNDEIGNKGVYGDGQSTEQGSVASDNLALLQMSTGKAFVKGYEIERTSTTFLDLEKPRTTKKLESQRVNYKTGGTLKLNNQTGSPEVGIGNTFIVSLRDQRHNGLPTGGSIIGKEIGVARVYDFALESGSYSATNSNVNEYDISLFDVQTFSEITLNQAITQSIPAFIKGKFSGATGFLRSNASNTTSLTLYEKSGELVPNEPIIINGEENSRVALAVTSFGVGDAKSLYAGPNLGNVGSAKSFVADVVQQDEFIFGSANVTSSTDTGGSGVSTITSGNPQFPGKLKVGNILKFGGLGKNLKTLARITEVNTNDVLVTGITTVAGVAEGFLPLGSVNTSVEVPDLTLVTTPFARSEDNTLFTRMPKNNISDVDVSSATLNIRKTFDVTINAADDQLTTAVSAGTNETFLPFDEERYSLVREDGVQETLTNDKFEFSDGNGTLQISNIGSDLSSNLAATLVATLAKTNVSAKVKRKRRVNSQLIDKSSSTGSGTGGATLNDGLTAGSYPFGTRVQDEKISLNTPDVLRILGIFESLSTSDPSAPKITLSSIDSPSGKTTDLIVGEKIRGVQSGALGIVAELLSDSQISFLQLNERGFREGEILNFEESNVQSIVNSIDKDSKNISKNYKFDSGQRSTIYNFGSIQRLSNKKSPTKKVKVYFESAYFESSDEGDVTVKNSYNDFDYTRDIQTVNNIRNTDIIDIRPRVSNYTVTESDRSPLEFFGRSFDASGNSAANVLASDESIIMDYSFFLGRIDKVYLTKNGNFSIAEGSPSQNPDKPLAVDGALEIAEISLPPYLYNVSDASISFLKHKRYRMQDIRQLEERIKNLEYYTTLSLLETDTANLFVTDENGLNKFKSGFFVDNFSSLIPQETRVPIKNSIDIRRKELRASHYCNLIDLQVGPVEGQNTISNGAEPEGTNIKKTGNLLTLDYEETPYLNQPFGTRSESVTPFILNFWKASLDLRPASDTWVDTVRLDANVIQREGNFASTVAEAERSFGSFDPQTGLTSAIWEGWDTVWTGETENFTTETRQEVFNNRFGDTQTDTIQDTFVERFREGTQTRTGQRQLITEQFDMISQGDTLVNTEVIPIMRSRNITFDGKGFKPQSKLFAFFDNVNMTAYCVPKLIEISMISGVFQVGETVTGETFNIVGTDTARIKFKVAASNHKEGPFNAPTRVFAKNPYTTSTAITSLETYSGTPGIVQLAEGGVLIPASYSSTSTTLNVDLESLAEQAQGDFFGNIETGMILKGGTSGAEARITDLRLISDYASSCLGSLFIPDPNVSSNPSFLTGKRSFTLIDNPQNNLSEASTTAQGIFDSAGTLETVQENIISVRNANVQTIDVNEERGIVERTSELFASEVIASQVEAQDDPLAQSFYVGDTTGIFATSCEVFFETVDDGNVPVQLDIRTVKLGVPSQEVVPFSQINLYPDQITTSTNGSVATKFTFTSPVYLSPSTEYAICMLSASAKYRVFISRIGENDLVTDEFVSNQPTLGSLFKSQNASTWEPSQWEDLKFILNRAEFVPSGSVQVYNPILAEGNSQVPKLLPNSLNLQTKKIRIGISSAFSGKANDVHPTIGNVISQSQDVSGASGNLVATAGIATGTLTVSRAGIGYTPASGNRGLIGVALSTITGSGRDATANVHFDGGVAVAATIVSGGEGYTVGDVLGISTNLGINARLTVASIGSTSELIVDNVQGKFAVGTGKTLFFSGGLNTIGDIIGITSAVTGAGGTYGAFPTTSGITTISDGLHIEVNHKNHGMHHQNNRVIISNVESDVPETKLTAPYANNSTASIAIGSTSEFTTFENVGVAASNPGYIKIKNEIIKYTGFSGDTLTGITRQQDSTLSQNYVTGDIVTKYEFGGVSLRRINLTHSLANVTDTNPISLDSYKIKLDMGANGIGRSSSESFPQLKIKETKSGGGDKIRATQNMQFDLIKPLIQNTTVQGTNLSAEIKTVSGTSVNNGSGQGIDTPFVVQESESVAINQSNYMTSPRLIASRVNETNNDSITVLPGDRSFNMTLNLDSLDSRLSPTVDMERMSALLISNRVDKLISNFKTDNRVDSLENDPSGFQYISKENVLETSGTSLKIVLDAHSNEYTDIRAFYAISENQGFDPIFVPFPGFDNLNERGQVISIDQSDGKTDVPTSPSEARGFLSNELQFKELTFSVSDLPSFKAFRIKFVMTSTNSSYVPRVSNLKVIALA